MQEPVMSKHSSDYPYSPLLLLVPLPFVLATCLPLDLDKPRAAPRPHRVAAVQADQPAVKPAASAPLHTLTYRAIDR
jgi:hypothetical protein